MSPNRAESMHMGMLSNITLYLRSKGVWNVMRHFLSFFYLCHLTEVLIFTSQLRVSWRACPFRAGGDLGVQDKLESWCDVFLFSFLPVRIVLNCFLLCTRFPSSPKGIHPTRLERTDFFSTN